MKSSLLGFVFASAILSLAHAQDASLSTSVEAQSSGYSQKGFTVGAEYMNFTDVSVDSKSTYRGDSRTFNESHMGSTHLGAAGIRLGYNKTPESGLGFNAGLTYLEPFNESERGDQKLNFLIPQANLTLGIGRIFTGYAGGNICVLGGSGEYQKHYKPGVGLQAGLGARITKGLALNAGYTMISQIIDSDENEIKETGTVVIGGFNSSVTYTF